MTKGLAHRGWRLVSNLETLHDVVQKAGISLPWLIEVVTNPFFGLTLVIRGVCGLPVAIQNQPGERINRVVLVAGWALFGLAAILVLATIEFSEFVRSSGVLAPNRIYEMIKSSRSPAEPIVTPRQQLHLSSGLTPRHYLDKLHGLGRKEYVQDAAKLGGQLMIVNGKVMSINMSPSTIGVLIMSDDQVTVSCSFGAGWMDRFDRMQLEGVMYFREV